MREKTYYDKFEAQLDLVEKCLKGIEALESKNTIKQFQSLVNLNGKRYEITIEELKHGIRKV